MTMKCLRSIAVVVALVLPAVPPASPAASTVSARVESGLLAQGLSQLRGIEELKSWFNTYKGHPRLIFLVSPT
jgi:hypothetical protein